MKKIFILFLLLKSLSYSHECLGPIKEEVEIAKGLSEVKFLHRTALKYEGKKNSVKALKEAEKLDELISHTIDNHYYELSERQINEYLEIKRILYVTKLELIAIIEITRRY